MSRKKRTPPKRAGLQKEDGSNKEAVSKIGRLEKFVFLEGAMLENFCAKLDAFLKESLVSIVAYGSAAKQQELSPTSNVNVMVIAHSFTAGQLSEIRQMLLKDMQQQRIIPVFWTLQEFESSWDVFPIEFADLKQNYKILFGKDVVGTMALDTKNFRHQLEFELRSKLTQFREAVAQVYGNKDSLRSLLLAASSLFKHLNKHAKYFLGTKYNPDWQKVFDDCAAIQQDHVLTNLESLQNLSEQLHKTICSLITAINE